MHYYSQSTNGLYHSEIHGKNLPEDARPISDQLYAQLMADQSSGKTIQADKNGNPVAVLMQPSAADVLKNQIHALENSVTPRRMREAVLGSDNGWLKDVEAKVEALRQANRMTDSPMTAPHSASSAIQAPVFSHVFHPYPAGT